MKDITYDKDGLVPAIIQDYQTKKVYMLGYMSEASLQKTEETGYVHFWSRSRKKLWMKGEESGNRLKVVEIKDDCDGDSLLVLIDLEGTHVCHTGALSCFDNKMKGIIPTLFK